MNTSSPSTTSRRRAVLFVAAIDVALLLLLETCARLFFPAPAGERFGVLTGLTIRIGLPALNQAVVPDNRLFWTLRPSMPPTRIEGKVGSGARLSFTLSTTTEGQRTVPGKARGGRTVVCLGDSCTFGVGVDDGETFPASMQRLLGARCLNAGVPGYSAFQGRRALQSGIEKWRPDAVVLQFGFNDAADWGGRGDREIRAASGVLRLLQASRLVQLAAQALAPKVERAAARRPRLTPEEFESELGGAIDLARAHGARAVLVAWPQRAQLTADRSDPYADSLRRLAAARGVGLADLLPEFRARGGESLYADLIHANAEGNRVAAECVSRALSATGFPGR